MEKGTIKGYARKVRHEKEEVIYESEFIVPAGFGEVGAILVENEHHKEMFLNNIVLDGLHNGPIHINCSSWVHSKFDNPKKRIFFTYKVLYLFNLPFYISFSWVISLKDCFRHINKLSQVGLELGSG